nr:zinc knuckle CX2CX4HX4C [Tanacetum cinerariifolium]
LFDGYTNNFARILFFYTESGRDECSNQEIHKIVIRGDGSIIKNTMCDKDDQSMHLYFLIACTNVLEALHICSPSRAYMSLENGHICSNKFDEKAHCAHMLEEYSHVLMKLMKKYNVGLAAKVKNIKGKLIGKDDKPLKSCLKTRSSKTNQVKPIGDLCKYGLNTMLKGTSNTNAKKDIHAAPITETVRTKDIATNKPSPNDLGLVLDGTNKSGVADESNASRRTQVTPKKVQVSVLTNDVKVLGANIAIPISVVDEICDKFANTLYGYFVGERLAFPIVEAYVKNAWAKYGFERVIFRNRFFFFNFSSYEGIIKTIEGGPWSIRSMPIFLNIWVANTKMKKDKITRVPVWVKIHNVHMIAFLETGLSLITTQLGRPIMLDVCTSDMCLNPWGRNTYARVLVELSADCVVMESIVVAIPLPKGEGHYLETLHVEYEWWRPRCSKCKFFDHDDDYCLAKVKKANSDPSSGKESGQDAGFINKKKGGNKAANKKNIQGIRFSKPKSNFMYRPVSKPSTTKEIASKLNTNAPSFKDDVNGADLQPNAPPKVIMDDSYGSTNEHGYFKDDIDLGQLRSNIEKLMEQDKVLDINTNNVIDGVVEPLNSMPKTNEGLTSTNTVPADVNDNYKGSLWEQFLKSHEASKSRHKSPMSSTDESYEDEVFMPGVIPGGGFLDDMEDDLDCYDGYEAHVYDLSEKEQAFCYQYDIRLNSRCRK